MLPIPALTAVKIVFDSYFESLLTDLTLPTGLPPSTSVNKSADTDLNGKSLITSRLRDTDVASLSIKDNKNGTVTLTIKPKAVQMSSPGADPQGRFLPLQAQCMTP